MTTKFKMISDKDVKAIRAAKKALTRIAKKLRKLNAAEDKVLIDHNDDWAAAARENYRMLDEVDALDISSLNGRMLSIRLLPSGSEAEAIEL